MILRVNDVFSMITFNNNNRFKCYMSSNYTLPPVANQHYLLITEIRILFVQNKYNRFLKTESLSNNIKTNTGTSAGVVKYLQYTYL